MQPKVRLQSSEGAKIRLDIKDMDQVFIRALQKEARSYIDEFTFYRLPNGQVEGWYAGELLAIWNGKNWVPVS